MIELQTLKKENEELRLKINELEVKLQSLEAMPVEAKIKAVARQIIRGAKKRVQASLMDKTPKICTYNDRLLSNYKKDDSVEKLLQTALKSDAKNFVKRIPKSNGVRFMSRKALGGVYKATRTTTKASYHLMRSVLKRGR